MKSKKSEFLKAFGKMWEIVKLLVNAVLDMGGGDEDLERLLKDPARIKKIAEFIVEKPATVLHPILASWRKFYQEYLAMDVDLSSVVIPPHQPGFDQVIVIPQGLTLNQVVAAMRNHFSVYTYVNDLDRDVPTNERDPKSGSYAIRVRNRREADEELKNLSANQIADMKLATLTLLERLVCEFKYYSETKSHLDIQNVTLCSGSRDSDGGVPRVYWHGSELDVYWCGTVNSSDRLRARRAAV